RTNSMVNLAQLNTITICPPDISSQVSAGQTPADSSPQQATGLSRQVLVKNENLKLKFSQRLAKYFCFDKLMKTYVQKK
ncbi:hypothetical protein K9M78_05910, partial [Candidatus Bipolaricaulota bacterium]|nr:hypothetical protein [Candidatus Bipolaricaulota bacterium]